MDFITQVALGGVIGYVCTNFTKPTKFRKQPLIIGSILGAAPDTDVLINFGHDVNNFVYHRSFTHSIIILLGISLTLYLITLKTHKNFLLKHNLSHTKWFLLLTLPLITHPILDSFTIYGTQLYWPFFTDLSGRSPESWSTLFIIDPLYSLPLFIGYIIILFKSNTQAKTILFSLAISSSYLIWSNIAKHLNDVRIKTFITEKNLISANFISTPTPFNTLLWRNIIMQKDEYYVVYNSLLRAHTHKHVGRHKNNKHILLPHDNAAVKKLDWFTHGFYRLDKNNGYISATDLRMGIEGAYVFRFAVAKNTSDLEIENLSKPFKIQENLDYSKLKDIFKKF